MPVYPCLPYVGSGHCLLQSDRIWLACPENPPKAWAPRRQPRAGRRLQWLPGLGCAHRSQLMVSSLVPEFLQVTRPSRRLEAARSPGLGPTTSRPGPRWRSPVVITALERRPGAQSPAAAQLSAAPWGDAGRGQPLACVVHRPGWIDLDGDLWQLNLGVHTRYGLRCSLMEA
jgi:hypothetical protein